MCERDSWPAPILETDRLWIFPLSPGLFRLLLEDRSALERRMGLSPSPPLWDRQTEEALESLCRRAERLSRRRLERGDWRWCAAWLLADKAARQCLGNACFMGPPGLSGWVELGYCMTPVRRGQGYMTEAAHALTHWAMEQPGVRTVRAQTDRDNPASCRVLEKCGFQLIRVLPSATETGAGLLWEYGGRPPVV